MKPLIVLMVPCAVRNKENWSGRKDQSQPGKGLPHPKAGLRLILAVAERHGRLWGREYLGKSPLATEWRSYRQM